MDICSWILLKASASGSKLVFGMFCSLRSKATRFFAFDHEIRYVHVMKTLNHMCNIILGTTPGQSMRHSNIPATFTPWQCSMVGRPRPYIRPGRFQALTPLYTVRKDGAFFVSDNI
jgi:hypothetical protein